MAIDEAVKPDSLATSGIIVLGTAFLIQASSLHRLHLWLARNDCAAQGGTDSKVSSVEPTHSIMHPEVVA